MEKTAVLDNRLHIISVKPDLETAKKFRNQLAKRYRSSWFGVLAGINESKSTLERSNIYKANGDKKLSTS